MAYQNWQGHPCLADAETMGEAIEECAVLVGQIQIRVEFEQQGLRDVSNGS